MHIRLMAQPAGSAEPCVGWAKPAEIKRYIRWLVPALKEVGSAPPSTSERATNFQNCRFRDNEFSPAAALIASSFNDEAPRRRSRHEVRNVHSPHLVSSCYPC